MSAHDVTHAGQVWIAYDDERLVEVQRTVETVMGWNEREPAEVQLTPAAGGETRWWGVGMRRARGVYEKCVDCDEGPGTCPGGRCRDCDLYWLLGDDP